MDKRKLFTEKRIKECFKLFDKVQIFLNDFQDDSGFIEIKEFKILLGDENVNDKQWEVALKNVDTDNDGKIDFKEFQKVFQMMAEESHSKL